ncbi:MAG: hypothetical protein FJW40_19515 [Acidobacteria bacterium]|nr:hypothetical protein [Acidobacteriota bacterium]
MNRKIAVSALVISVLGCCAAMLTMMRRAPRVEAAPAAAMMQLSGGGQMMAAAVGHEFRQDDSPAIAAGPDGSLWVAWLSFVGDRDDVAIRQYKNGKWGTLQWVPGTSGDSWLPQMAVDGKGRAWVIWSQQKDGNWDLYARWFDAGEQTWGPLERLTTDAMPDINPRAVGDGRGRIGVVWQGFRGRQSAIFARVLSGETWGPEIRVTKREANHWEPAAAFDSRGGLWVAYDSYAKGNYDVLLAKVAGGRVEGEEMEVAASGRFEARATVAVDAGDRVWVAWESGEPGWGKDQGYIIRANRKGVQLGATREPRIRILDNGTWRMPAQLLSEAFRGGNGNTYQPHVVTDARGNVWVAAKTRYVVASGNQNRGYWEYRVTHLDGNRWGTPVTLPNSKGRSSTRIHAVAAAGGLWLAWPTDNRGEGFYHRPLRQQVMAGMLPATDHPAAAEFGTAVYDAPAATGAHEDEAGDVRAIRTYTAAVGGKPHRIVRGDFHRHTELSWDGGGTQDGSLQDFYRYMIDAGAMDFGASTDHQGGAWPYWWWYTQKMTDMYHVPGAYVSIFGYERSAVFPNGHRNMVFARRSDSRVTPFFLKNGAQGFGLPNAPLGDEPGVGTGELVANDTKLLYEDIRNRNALAISHTSGTRMGTDWRDNDPNLEPVVEIYQGARTNYEKLGAPHVAEEPRDAAHMKQAGYQPEGMVSNAWAKGYKLGIIASSDHGSTHLSYALVYTDNPTRQGVLDAIRKRHTYGAMDNIILDVRMGSHFMGDEFPLTKALPIRVKARGTKKIARVEFIRDSQVVHTAEPGTQEATVEFLDRGDVSGRHYYYVRVVQEDTLLAWSSPFFVNYGK